MHVELPDTYPYKSPSIGFINRLYHPNVDEMYVIQLISQTNTPPLYSLYILPITYMSLTLLLACPILSHIVIHRSGSVCLDVINQTWSPMYDLTNIFEVFLPQLLTYPNPTDPLNGEAAALQMREPERYKQKVREYVQKYAKPEDFPSGSAGDAEDDDDHSDFSMTDSEAEDDDQLPDDTNGAPSNIGGAGKADDADLSGKLGF